MTIPIEFSVTRKPMTPGRQDTEQTFNARIVEDIVLISEEESYYTSAKDRQSGQGSFIADWDEFEISIVDVNASIPAIDELVASLRTHQIATIDLTSYERIGKVLKFRRKPGTHETTPRGCTHAAVRMRCQVMP